MIVVDGARGEGGGQILRTALALSLATGQPFRIERIRANRPAPGLKAQHLAALRAIAALTDSRFAEAVAGQESLTFVPGPFLRARGRIDVGTAGSLSLLLQSLLLPLAVRGPGGTAALELTGGTDVAWSPPADYTARVFLPRLEGLVSARLTLLRRGYYPRGGGRIRLRARPCPGRGSKRLEFTRRGPLREIGGVSHGSRNLSRAAVAERQAEAAAAALAGLGVKVDIGTSYGPSFSTGSGITLWAVFSPPAGAGEGGSPAVLGSDALGARGLRAERVGEEAAARLLEEIESGAVVDAHLADHLVPWIGMFGGALKTSRISGHVIAGAYVTGLFLGTPVTVSREEGLVTARPPERG